MTHGGTWSDERTKDPRDPEYRLDAQGWIEIWYTVKSVQHKTLEKHRNVIIGSYFIDKQSYRIISR
jgi:hypothetical protein